MIKIINLLENTPYQATRFRTKKWVEINDESRGPYNTDYSNAYILVNGTITVAEVVVGGGNNSIQVVFKNCAPFTNCISEINNTQIDNARYIDAVMPMYNSIEYGNNYSKKSGSLGQH